MSSSNTETNNKDSNTSQPAPAQSVTDNYYQRKKNWVSGIDNDTLLGLGVAAATTIASVAAFPMIKDAWERFVNRPPAPPAVTPPAPAIEEYIPPTQPNGHAEPPVVEQTPPPPVVEPPKEVEEEPDGLFHEAELRRKQKLMGQRPRGNRYDSPFGKDIGGL